VNLGRERVWYRHRLAPLAAVLLGYLLSRVIFVALVGIEFDASPLGWFWQYIDPKLLLEDPWRSLYYHHTQPPLFNVYLAAVLRFSSGDPSSLFWVSYIALGLVLHGSIYAILSALGVRVWLAVAAPIFFAFSPASILYESWLFYTYPLAALLVASALSLHRLASHGFKRRDALLFFALLSAIALTRSLFHLTWILFVTGLTLSVAGEQRRRLVPAALVALALVSAVYFKNWIEFGTFSTSSWLGMNLARLAVESIPSEERVDLVRQGTISSVSLVPPFSFLKMYPAELRQTALRNRRGMVNHPILIDPLKSTRAVNLNHLAYIEISKRYRTDALTLMRRDPKQYLGSVANGWLLFTLPPSEYSFLERNRKRLSIWDPIWNSSIYGVASTFRADVVAQDLNDREYLQYRVSYFWVALALASLGLAVYRGVRDFRRGESGNGLCLLYLSLTIVYVSTVGNALDYRENNRMRFMIEPMITVLIFWMLDRALSHWTTRRHAGRSENG
jgi:hypothetical protein